MRWQSRYSIEAAKVAEIPGAAQVAKEAAENYFLFKELILCPKLKFSLPPLIFQT